MDRTNLPVLRSLTSHRLGVFRSRNVLGGIGALLLLGVGVASAQETGAGRDVFADRYSFAVPRTNWSSSAERSGLGELALVGVLRRHGEFHQYKEAPASGLKLYHYTAGLKFELPVMDRSRFDLVADFGLGATRLRSARLPAYGPSEQHVSETFLSLLGGLSVRYAVSDGCRLFVGARRLFYLEGSDELAIDGLRDPDQILESGSWTFPVTMGLRFNFR